jgi:hypothetical protein
MMEYLYCGGARFESNYVGCKVKIDKALVKFMLKANSMNLQLRKKNKYTPAGQVYR